MGAPKSLHHDELEARRAIADGYIDLPSWAQSRTGRALVAAIIAEQPDSRIESHNDTLGGMVLVYEGRNAMLLRLMHDQALTRATDEANARYAGGMSWDHAAVELMKLHREEKPDALIERLLHGEQRRAAA